MELWDNEASEHYVPLTAVQQYPIEQYKIISTHDTRGPIASSYQTERAFITGLHWPICSVEIASTRFDPDR